MTLRLEPVTPDRYHDLRQLELTGATGPAGRFAGAVPSTATYAQALWSGVLAQRAVVHEGALVGLVVAYDPDPRSATAWLGAWGRHDRLGTGLVAGGVLHFLDWVFAAWPLRWIYASTTDAALASYASALDQVASEVGRFPQRHRRGDGLVDRVLLACDRRTVERVVRPRLRAAEVARPRRPTPSLGELVRGLGDELGRATEGWSPDDRLVADLGLDSLELFLVAVWLEERWSASVDPEALAASSLAELHRLLVAATASAAEAAP